MNRAERRRQKRKSGKPAKNVKPVETAYRISEQSVQSIPQSIESAVQHHTAGRLPQAENICQQILQVDPNHPVALHLHGVIAQKSNKYELAEELISKALAIKPDYAEAHNNLGVLQQKLERQDEAVVNYQKAIDIKPGFAEAHKNLGTALKELGQLEDALASYEEALAIKPDDADAIYNLAVTHQDQGNIDEAVNCYLNAIAIKPDYAEAHNNLGLVFQGLRRFEDAILCYNMVHSAYNQAKTLECLFALERYDDFYINLNKLIKADKNNLLAAAISAFASHQLRRADPHPFCKTPMNFIRVYENQDGMNDVTGLVSHLAGELKSRADVWEPIGKTTKKGFQSQSTSNLFANPVGQLANLEQILKDKINNYRFEFLQEKCEFIRSFPKILTLNGWVVRLLNGGHQTEHIHPAGWLSGVFYLQVPKYANQEEGSIEFGLWGYSYSILNDNYPRKRYYPKNGDIILFPSSLFHRTIPFHSNKERMSIAFDLIQT